MAQIDIDERVYEFVQYLLVNLHSDVTIYSETEQILTDAVRPKVAEIAKASPDLDAAGWLRVAELAVATTNGFLDALKANPDVPPTPA